MSEENKPDSVEEAAKKYVLDLTCEIRPQDDWLNAQDILNSFRSGHAFAKDEIARLGKELKQKDELVKKFYDAINREGGWRDRVNKFDSEARRYSELRLEAAGELTRQREASKILVEALEWMAPIGKSWVNKDHEPSREAIGERADEALDQYRQSCGGGEDGND